MKEKSWVCTLITQLSLCMVAYIAIHIGQPQKLTHGNLSSEGSSNYIYFISIAGGFRPLEEQTLLLQQMVKVEKTYKARFVVEFSELGKSDPLLQNVYFIRSFMTHILGSGFQTVVIRHNISTFQVATMFPELRNMPWYLAGAAEGQGKTYFLKKIKIPYGLTLDIITLDTFILQDQSSARGNDQIVWLTRTLNESNSDWKIVVGFHQLISCGYNILKTKETPFERLHDMLLQYGVDAYMSMKTCAGDIQGGAARLSDTGLMDKVPHLTPINQNLIPKQDTDDGFLLHQVSSLEMVTFVVKLTGEVEHRLSFQQGGRAAM